MKNKERGKKSGWFAVIFAVINILAIVAVYRRETVYIDYSLSGHAQEIKRKTEDVMENYKHSFQLFTQMLSREIENNPDPDDIWDYLKKIDPVMLGIEGDTFDGLYMYYKDRYLYSWDTPYSQYEDTGYIATERPWYKDAVAGNGDIVFTPPYMSYANHYILSTISQLQPDGETVFAYDIKMGDIQNLVSTLQAYGDEEMIIFDYQGTIVGSTNDKYLGGSLSASTEDSAKSLSEAKAALDNAGDITEDEKSKLEDQVKSADAFHTFRKNIDEGLSDLMEDEGKAGTLKIGNKSYYGFLLLGDEYSFLITVPFFTMLKATVQIWLLPLLVLELLLIYILSRIGKWQRNRELQAAYVELGQTQKRLEIALSAAQKAAAIDDLTGMMNFKSFRKGVADILEEMEPDETGILIMIDGDHFKLVNDKFGHTVGDEVIKLSAQMIIGRIRTIDLASRLHGDEFAIFVSNTDDYSVAQTIMKDINSTLAKEAARRKMPSITMSAGAVIAKHGDIYANLAKAADAAMYKAKETHNGGFASVDDL
ncbi:MAG: sensor domain-containing diguanylate cyclase [Eubacteriales bacterium]|nr:sensor domain-containing diguanylate cyclase [Eubacteriales bacterium]